MLLNSLISLNIKNIYGNHFAFFIEHKKKGLMALIDGI